MLESTKRARQKDTKERIEILKISLQFNFLISFFESYPSWTVCVSARALGERARGGDGAARAALARRGARRDRLRAGPKVSAQFPCLLLCQLFVLGSLGPLQRRVRAFATITTLQSLCKIIRQSAL